ncbi:ABC transporter ATP-binding protein [Nodosilinea sp. E11]|uniref:metal ABC transporter ATP-binding protein n=1 Tax=Nodosilinea sp. E11 TaxID=3037479 RepID=UPI002935189C|nr:ABC transporter ATP-binding protein [Nodosilinea sp. E11]WOD40976.1 ABC transporter ATP-binding protein [Nodosilinea sp. E11]
MLEVQNLSVNYRGRQALDDISLRLGAGELVGLIGPNGAGKSTLIQAMLGLVPCRGQVLFKGAPLRRRQSVAYVPQRSRIDWDYPITAGQVAMMAQAALAGWFRQPSQRAKQRVTVALERVDMLDLCDRPIGQLSGGQQQRIFLARALAQEADLLLLDEPFTGIDKKTEALMLAIFAELQQEGKTLVVCSHEWGEALHRYDRLLLLNRRLLADDTPQAVMTLDNIQRAYGQGPEPTGAIDSYADFFC